MDGDIFWDVFRDTGDPLCWLMSRAGKTEEKKKEQPDDRAARRPLS